MPTKHEIEIPGLPEGYKLIRVLVSNDRYRNSDGTSTIRGCELVIEKIQPRRIVLEETEERANWGTEQLKFAKGTTVTVNSHKIWRVVEGAL